MPRVDRLDEQENEPPSAPHAVAAGRCPSFQISLAKSIFRVLPLRRSANATPARFASSTWEFLNDVSHFTSASISANTKRAISFCCFEGKPDTRLIAFSSNAVMDLLNSESSYPSIILSSPTGPLRCERFASRLRWLVVSPQSILRLSGMVPYPKNSRG